MRLPRDLSYDVFGEGILEVAGRCLASVCGGDLSLIKALAENTKADDFMRIQAVKEIFKLKLNDRQIIDIDLVEEDMFVGKSARLEASKQNIHMQFIDDTIAEMEDWFCFSETYRAYFAGSSKKSEPQEIVPKKPKIGRNDPCPCGSGKKYKKCCGK